LTGEFQQSDKCRARKVRFREPAGFGKIIEIREGSFRDAVREVNCEYPEAEGVMH